MTSEYDVYISLTPFYLEYRYVVHAELHKRGVIGKIVFLFLQKTTTKNKKKKHMLLVLIRSASPNEYPLHMFSWKRKKTINIVG